MIYIPWLLFLFFGILGKFGVKILAYGREKIQSRFYLGDLVTRTGDRDSFRIQETPG